MRARATCGAALPSMPHGPAVAAFGEGFHLVQPADPLHLGRDLPAKRLGPPRQFLRPRPSQAATGGQMARRARFKPERQPPEQQPLAPAAGEVFGDQQRA